MNKAVLMLTMSVGMTLGGFVPMMFGDNDLLSSWSILGGLIGGGLGIWLGVKLSQAMS